MRYFYEPPKVGTCAGGELYPCNHPLYKYCTLFKIEDRGLAVVQKRFNSKMKISWWDSVDPRISADISVHEGFKDFLNDKAEKPDENGLYPTIGVRRIMWALRMKPLKREVWETEL